MLLEIILK